MYHTDMSGLFCSWIIFKTFNLYAMKMPLLTAKTFLICTVTESHKFEKDHTKKLSKNNFKKWKKKKSYLYLLFACLKVSLFLSTFDVIFIYNLYM